MKNKKKIKIELTPNERKRLRTNKIKHSEVSGYLVDDLSLLLDVPFERAREIHALAEFQTVPSVGIKFANDLIRLGYFSLGELSLKEGHKLIDEMEQSAGIWMDPCVEDQCLLVVHYAINRDLSKKWWSFTEERKKYRTEFGYPADRPKKGWYENLS